MDNADTTCEAPGYGVIYHGGTNTENGTFCTYNGVSAIHHYGADSNYILSTFRTTFIGVGSSEAIEMIILTGMQQILVPASPQYFHITEYGMVGEYIAGNFDGNLVNRSGINHVIPIDFRIKRT